MFIKKYIYKIISLIVLLLLSFIVTSCSMSELGHYSQYKNTMSSKTDVIMLQMENNHNLVYSSLSMHSRTLSPPRFQKSAVFGGEYYLGYILISKFVQNNSMTPYPAYYIKLVNSRLKKIKPYESMTQCQAQHHKENCYTFTQNSNDVKFTDIQILQTINNHNFVYSSLSLQKRSYLLKKIAVFGGGYYKGFILKSKIVQNKSMTPYPAYYIKLVDSRLKKIKPYEGMTQCQAQHHKENCYTFTRNTNVFKFTYILLIQKKGNNKIYFDKQKHITFSDPKTHYVYETYAYRTVPFAFNISNGKFIIKKLITPLLTSKNKKIYPVYYISDDPVTKVYGYNKMSDCQKKYNSKYCYTFTEQKTVFGNLIKGYFQKHQEIYSISINYSRQQAHVVNIKGNTSLSKCIEEAKLKNHGYIRFFCMDQYDSQHNISYEKLTEGWQQRNYGNKPYKVVGVQIEGKYRITEIAYYKIARLCQNYSGLLCSYIVNRNKYWWPHLRTN